ncbi:NADP-dependent oxidoreductase [Microbispora triticiradicis]|uniref:NADP-dependent oxidoreductase n=2 Tax=Microbispora TaxID=2005 RepID=A0ABY3LPF7_9ACTN|nr:MULTISPECIES: NADP-dependent oxidoreductase [Microbispora]TLP52105.1 NADP-dependent oxidoreductase [Microbispora fusca]TYB46049.1 NADP-dependent oxidoreductase [Microbispora tritici]GLW25101.1 NADPH:quinone reductase [Microbispora amethystogenes]
MRALVGRDGVVQVAEVPEPEPGPGQVRIRVEAAAVNPIDLFTVSGALPDYGLTPRLDTYALGWDVAGVIDRVGPGVTAAGPGDRVIGLSDRLTDPIKAQAELVVLDEHAVAPAPAGMPAVEAATLPLNTLTAVQALDLAGLAEGASLLVTGAAGGLGGYLVELAALRGIRVAAVAAPGDEALVRGFGAEWFVARGADLAGAVRAVVPGGVDGVVDAAVVGLPALDAVRNGGVFVAVGAGQAPLPLRGIRASTVFVRADAAQLRDVVRLAEAGRLTTRVAGVHPLDRAAEAHERLVRGGVRGRLVLTP